MILAIARRELRGLLGGVQGWVLFGLTQALLAWVFLSLLDHYQVQLQPQLVKLNSGFGVTELVVARFLSHPLLLLSLLLAAALLAMRLIAEERRQATLALLLAAPVGSTEIVLGKYLGALGYCLLLLALWALMPLTLLLGTELDLGRLLAGLLGLALLAALLSALALWASALTSQPGLAAAVCFGGGLLLMLLQSPDGGPGGALDWLGFPAHLAPFFSGAVSTADLAYFLLLSTALLALAVRRLDALRVQP